MKGRAGRREGDLRNGWVGFVQPTTAFRFLKFILPFWEHFFFCIYVRLLVYLITCLTYLINEPYSC